MQRPDYKKLLTDLKTKSLLDYHYFHLFAGKRLDLDYNINGYDKRFIIYLLKTDLVRFFSFFNENKNEIFSDVFIERCRLDDNEKNELFSYSFKGLFWLKIMDLNINDSDYKRFFVFLFNNSLDINRIFIQNCGLSSDFMKILSSAVSSFGNLSYLNLDNNLIQDSGAGYLLDFIRNNDLDLEYLSLVCNGIKNDGLCSILDFFQKDKKLKVLDISGNEIGKAGEETLLDLMQNEMLGEMYMKEIEFSDNFIKTLIIGIEKNSFNFNILKISLTENQMHFKKELDDLAEKKAIVIDSGLIENRTQINTTVYLKEFLDEDHVFFHKIEDDNFFVINRKNKGSDMKRIIEDKNLYHAANLFLFDITCFEKIFLMMEKYQFNYIYIENYHIEDRVFFDFINKIISLKNKRYKVNLISIEISETQLDYLLGNFPKNIIFIELNLNKIKNREKYISRMISNEAIIFENHELYKKIFK